MALKAEQEQKMEIGEWRRVIEHEAEKKCFLCELFIHRALNEKNKTQRYTVITHNE